MTTLAEFERALQAVHDAGGNVTAAAKKLAIPRSTLWDRLKRCGHFGITASASSACKAKPLLTSDDDVRKARNADSKLSKAQAELKAERKKRRQSEADLLEATGKLKLYTQTAKVSPCPPPPPQAILIPRHGHGDHQLCGLAHRIRGA